MVTNNLWHFPSSHAGAWLPDTSRAIGLLVALLGVVVVSTSAPAAGVVPAAERSEPVAAHVLDAYRQRPIAFERNRGQTDPRVDFVARGPGYTAFLTAGEAVLALRAGGKRAVLRMALVGANPAPRVRGSDLASGRIDYMKGGDPKQKIRVPSYARVTYDGVYPDIGLVYRGDHGQLEYDFVVGPGADPGAIRLAFAGVIDCELTVRGDLLLRTAVGLIRKPPPVIYQEIEGVRRIVSGHYVIDDQNQLRFALGTYDATRTLVIDPLLVYSTYLGGQADDDVGGIAVDAAGGIYVTGTTSSLDFPDGTDADGPAAVGSEDVFVTKLGRDGRHVYTTYLGTECGEAASGIAVDAHGSAYVTGRARDGLCALPDPPGVFVAKLTPAGAGEYFLVFGPDTLDSSHGRAIAVDGAGQAYVTGVTEPSSPGFPTTDGAYRSTPCESGPLGGSDGFVAKVNAAGSALVYATYLCGSGHDSPNAIALDAAGNAYVAGSTDSRDFPVQNAYQATHPGTLVLGTSAFVTQVNAAGSALVYSTYLGGSDETVAHGIALDTHGQAHVTGATQATDFPTTAGVVQPTAGSRSCVGGLCADAFVTKLDASGSTLRYSTYLFGDFDEEGVGIAVDEAGRAYVVGTTNSSTFPLAHAFQRELRGSLDAFVTRLDPSGSSYEYSSFLGGGGGHGYTFEGEEEGLAIAVDGAGNAVVGGYTRSFDFWTSDDAYRRALTVGTCGYTDYLCADVFVTRIAASGPGVTPAVRVSVDTGGIPAGGTITATWAGIPSPRNEDELRLYRLGSSYSDPVTRWSTAGAAEGALELPLPETAPGWYELRLLSPDTYEFLAVIARSDAFWLDAFDPSATPIDDVPGTPLVCATPRCLLEAAIGSPSCGGMPRRIRRSLERATVLLERAAGARPRQASRLQRAVRRQLRRAERAAVRAGSRKAAKLPAECVSAIRAAAAALDPA